MKRLDFWIVLLLGLVLCGCNQELIGSLENETARMEAMLKEAREDLVEAQKARVEEIIEPETDDEKLAKIEQKISALVDVVAQLEGKISQNKQDAAAARDTDKRIEKDLKDTAEDTLPAPLGTIVSAAIAGGALLLRHRARKETEETRQHGRDLARSVEPYIRKLGEEEKDILRRQQSPEVRKIVKESQGKA
jgi:hypothetical protein